MKALTVQQPWAWAIIHGGKDVENRTQSWAYRGPLAIHAGLRVSQRGMDSPLVRHAWERSVVGGHQKLGVILGVVDLVEVHQDEPGCCTSPWAETDRNNPHAVIGRHIWHLVLANPRPVAPLPVKGRLGLWNLNVDLEVLDV